MLKLCKSLNMSPPLSLATPSLLHSSQWILELSPFILHQKFVRCELSFAEVALGSKKIPIVYVGISLENYLEKNFHSYIGQKLSFPIRYSTPSLVHKVLEGFSFCSSHYGWKSQIFFKGSSGFNPSNGNDIMFDSDRVFLLKNIDVFSLLRVWLEAFSYFLSMYKSLHHSRELALQKSRLSLTKKRWLIGFLHLFLLLLLH